MTRPVADALIQHHLDDVTKGLRSGSLEIAEFSFHDVLEIFSELRGRVRDQMTRKWAGKVWRAKAKINAAGGRV